MDSGVLLRMYLEELVNRRESGPVLTSLHSVTGMKPGGKPLSWPLPRRPAPPSYSPYPPGPEAFSSSPLCPVVPKAFLWSWWAIGIGSLIPTGSGVCQPVHTGNGGHWSLPTEYPQTPRGDSDTSSENSQSTVGGQGRRASHQGLSTESGGPGQHLPPWSFHPPWCGLVGWQLWLPPTSLCPPILTLASEWG